ncbi:hypothetical protein [Actinomadura formosensis]|uniref:hypothetical protein n=1 Tax=Actinomadura formosensis TaxID=60706 RepID=UPI003D8D36D4
MSKLRFPEWFIGSPLHGQDRLTVRPTVRTNEIRTVDFSAADLLDESTTITEYSYHRTRFAIGR